MNHHCTAQMRAGPGSAHVGRNSLPSAENSLCAFWKPTPLETRQQLASLETNTWSFLRWLYSPEGQGTDQEFYRAEAQANSAVKTNMSNIISLLAEVQANTFQTGQSHLLTNAH